MKDLYKTYRKDIDGLRFIAVFFVFINHLNNKLMPMGYLGVDIFFVLSGFVISMSLLNSKITDYKSYLISFFNKRIKRIIPALFTYVLVIGFLAALVIPTPGSTLKTGMFSMIGVSNIFLFHQSVDYFASSSNLNAFTNTWSLSVEEQFYFIFPLLAWLFFFKKGLKKSSLINFLLVMIFLTSSSFIIFFISYKSNTNFAYYMLPARFWEIGIGCITYIFLSITNISKNKNSNFFSFISLITIFGAILIPLNNPILSTFLVTISTAFLIIFNIKKSPINNFLTNRLFLYFGRRSYSIYLWHWGIISLYKWSFGVSKTTLPFVISLSLLLAILTFEFIENPLRHAKWFSKKLFNIISGFFISLIGIVSLYTFRMVIRYADELPLLYKTNVVSRKSVAAFIGCMGDELPEKCLMRKSNKSHAFLIGDSHLVSLVPSIGSALKDFNYEHSFWGGVKHIRNIFNTNCIDNDCFNDIDDLKQIFSNNNLRKDDLIIYTLSRNRIFFDKSKSNKLNSNVDLFNGFSREKFVNSKKLLVLEKAIQELAKFVSEKEAKLILIDSLPVTCKKNIWIKSVSKFSNEICKVSTKLSKDDRRPLTEMFLRITKNNQNVFYVDPHDELCSDGFCQIKINDKPLYTDNSPHLGWESRFIFKDFFKNQFKEIIFKY